MSQKYAVIQGALCECQFGDFPDKLKVLSHKKYYANDPNGADKLIATTMEIGGSTFEKNTFGQCKLQPTGSSFKPCQIVVTKWDNFYKNVEFSNGGKIILEDSKATCPISGSPCISIITHGQSMEGSSSSVTESNEEIQHQINPMVNINNLDEITEIKEVKLT
ncbi:DUF4280 domain-containing protein [Olleya sp. YSTF-M6]|uniref:DUF4280 domain-containing protein n=1 Tax=Olleya sediminilitoris TaxID=2795739 RepID=A0ABS1WKC2_9FLAO|nr:DUF4280 domain-containing protein [Olleya sediminilitoris]MBL7559572.1 DUF4280 domain-containing protein [Olleya sediminilitoris]